MEPTRRFSTNPRLERSLQESMARRMTRARRTYKTLENEIEAAWGIIANAFDGDWTKASQEWQDAAHCWGVRNEYRQEYPIKDSK